MSQRLRPSVAHLTSKTNTLIARKCFLWDLVAFLHLLAWRSGGSLLLQESVFPFSFQTLRIIQSSVDTIMTLLIHQSIVLDCLWYRHLEWKAKDHITKVLPLLGCPPCTGSSNATLSANRPPETIQVCFSVTPVNAKRTVNRAIMAKRTVNRTIMAKTC